MEADECRWDVGAGFWAKPGGRFMVKEGSFISCCGGRGDEETLEECWTGSRPVSSTHDVVNKNTISDSQKAAAEGCRWLESRIECQCGQQSLSRPVYRAGFLLDGCVLALKKKNGSRDSSSPGSTCSLLHHIFTFYWLPGGAELFSAVFSLSQLL